MTRASTGLLSRLNLFQTGDELVKKFGILEIYLFDVVFTKIAIHI